MAGKKLFKQFSNDCNPIFLVLTVLIICWALYQYSASKTISPMAGNMASAPSVGVAQNQGAVKPANPLGTNEVPASVSGVKTTMPGMPSNCNQQAVAKPGELLPKDKNNEWAKMNPTGQGDLKNVNLLKAGHHIGINTVGNSLRNANLQIRSEPPNPQMNTGPWNASTIDADTMRRPLEFGGN
tara:strand:- start:936 stop:1484 length:549 start_codon:yes stop_codon:yes gene_type:complete